ncbi:MAG TPA: hypothetical protein VK395_03395, partial [Gemmataceae bacterium]|nr:hypothetical protein [Gemmataceae bacterium]
MRLYLAGGTAERAQRCGEERRDEAFWRREETLGNRSGQAAMAAVAVYPSDHHYSDNASAET